MASFSLLNNEQIRDLALNWVDRVDGFEHLGGGLNNTSYLLSTDVGKLVMTVVDFPGAMPCRTHVELLVQLALQGVPANEAVTTKNGQYIVESGDKPVMVKRFLDGTSPDVLDTGQLVEVAQLLGRISRVHTPSSLGYERRRLPAGAPSMLADWQDREFAAWVVSNNRRIVELETAGLPVGLVHGDLFADNTIVGSDGGISIIDWETASIDLLIIDIAFALIGNCRSGRGLDAERKAALLRAYESVRPMTEQEHALLDEAILFAATILGFWRYQNLNHLHQVPEKAHMYLEMVDFVEHFSKSPE